MSLFLLPAPKLVLLKRRSNIIQWVERMVSVFTASISLRRFLFPTSSFCLVPIRRKKRRTSWLPSSSYKSYSSSSSSSSSSKMDLKTDKSGFWTSWARKASCLTERSRFSSSDRAGADAAVIVFADPKACKAPPSEPSAP